MSERKKILIVSSAFYPEISPRSYRATELAKEFAHQGHNVTVISKYREYDYTSFLQKYALIFKMYPRPVFPSVPDYKRPFLKHLSRIARRMLSLTLEYPLIEEMFLVKRALKNAAGFDIIISFAVPYPVHWGVAWARTRKHKIAEKWIADCGDPYMFCRLDTFRKPFYFSFPEKKFCKKCDFITVPFEEMRTQFYPQFYNKIRVIPQGFNFNDVTISQGETNKSAPVFLFAGSVIPGKRDLSAFLDFLVGCEKDFEFIIYTNQQYLFEKYKKSLNGKIILKEYIERLQLIFEMSKVDFLVNVDTILDNHSNVEAIPSKLIDYALSGKPILNLSSAGLDKALVLEFLEGNYSRQRNIDLDRYNIKKVTAQFLAL